MIHNQKSQCRQASGNSPRNTRSRCVIIRRSANNELDSREGQLTKSDSSKRLQRMWVVGARIDLAWRRLGESARGAHRPGRGTFCDYWPLREHVCHPLLTGRQKKFEVKFVWLRKHGKFEATLRRGGGLAFINANNACRMRRQSRIGAGKQRRTNPLQAAGEDRHCNRSRIAALF